MKDLFVYIIVIGLFILGAVAGVIIAPVGW